MNLNSLAKSFANVTYDKLAPNLGKMLLWTGTIGWVLSAFAQITAIAINNKIPKDQKKFLIPQEIADAAVNIASFFILTNSCSKFGEQLVKSGRLANPKIREFLKLHGIDKKLEKGGLQLNNFLKTYGVNTKLNGKNFDIEKLPEFKNDKAFQHKYYKFYDGINFIFSTIGSIISCNIVTPYARNYLGAKEQKRSLAKDKLNNPIMLPTSPVLPAQNRLSMDDYKSKFSSTPLGSMKI